MFEQVPPFAVSVAALAGGRVVVVAVKGDLDLLNAAKLRGPLLEALGSSLVVLDLSACTLCDSAGLETILEANRLAEAAGVPYRIAGARPDVVRTFGVTGAEAVLDLFPDVESALR